MRKPLFPTVPTGFIFAIAALVVLLILPAASPLRAQQPPPPGQLLSPDQLDDMVAPIALYPDPLVSQILVAVTYPLEVVEASQWVQRNPNLTGAALTQAAEQQDWDPSVQALVSFPDLLKYLTEDISWTTNLGNAFLAQQADVMDAIQRMRARAAQTGKLVTTPQQQVILVPDSGVTVYEILPVDPDVIYLPVYDPYWIWGTPRYYPYARWYYAPHAPSLYFNRGISINLFIGSGWRGWNGWGWRPGWGSHNIVVNNTFIHRYNFNATHVPNLTGTTPWAHDATHRQGVPYPTTALNDRFRSNVRDNLRPREAPRQQGPTPVAPVAPTRSAPNGQRQDQGNRGRDLSPNTPGRDRGAFGGIENGDASRLHSDHGYASLGPNRTNPVKPTAPAAGPVPNHPQAAQPQVQPQQNRPQAVQPRVQPQQNRPQANQPAPPQARSAPAPRPAPEPRQAPAHQESPKSNGGNDHSREGRR